MLPGSPRRGHPQTPAAVLCLRGAGCGVQGAGRGAGQGWTLTAALASPSEPVFWSAMPFLPSFTRCLLVAVAGGWAPRAVPRNGDFQKGVKIMTVLPMLKMDGVFEDFT